VGPQRVAGRQRGVLEVVGGVVGHAEAAHHAAGRFVDRRREADQGGQVGAGRVEREPDGLSGGFGGEALTPGLTGDEEPRSER